MACFIVSAAEAVVVSVVKKAEEKKEIKAKEEGKAEVAEIKIPLSRKLKWLRNMLLGGSAILLFEHIWHGEIVPWFPFLTAMSDKGEAIQMLKEMATVGVAMAALITVIWLVACFVADSIMKKSAKEEKAEQQ